MTNSDRNTPIEAKKEPKVEYKELQGVKRICGDYAAWHEIGTYCEYVFGHNYTLGDISENICEEADITWEELLEYPTDKMDALVKKIVENSDDGYDYCDMEIGTVLCKMIDGKIVKTYMEL